MTLSNETYRLIEENRPKVNADTIITNYVELWNEAGSSFYPHEMPDHSTFLICATLQTIGEMLSQQFAELYRVFSEEVRK